MTIMSDLSIKNAPLDLTMTIYLAFKNAKVLGLKISTVYNTANKTNYFLLRK